MAKLREERFHESNPDLAFRPVLPTKGENHSVQTTREERVETDHPKDTP